MRNQALACIQHIVDHSLNLRNQSLLMGHTAKHNGIIEAGGMIICTILVHTSYVTGQALYFLLKAYDF